MILRGRRTLVRSCTSKMDSFFSISYDEARARFRHLASAAGVRCDAWSHDCTGPDRQELFTEIVLLGARRPRRAVVHLSGVHGVEGFAGSAVQCDLLHQPPPLAENDALILVHIVNPFGMSWGRRVNATNVDLNRNCLSPEESYAGVSAAYAELNTFLNPAADGGPTRSYARFLLGAAKAVARFGLGRVTQAIAGGQYAFPQGIMYGGSRLEQEPSRLFDWLLDHLGGVQAASGRLHALCEENRDWQPPGADREREPARQRLRPIFCPTATAWRKNLLRRGRIVVEQALRGLAE
jgi:hypothetical protein